MCARVVTKTTAVPALRYYHGKKNKNGAFSERVERREFSPSFWYYGIRTPIGCMRVKEKGFDGGSRRKEAGTIFFWRSRQQEDGVHVKRKMG